MPPLALLLLLIRSRRLDAPANLDAGFRSRLRQTRVSEGRHEALPELFSRLHRF